MIYIIHGEDLVSSRQFILNLQKQNNVGNKKELTLGDASVEFISELISAVDMFGEKQMFVFDVSKMGRTNMKDYVATLENVPEDMIFVVLSSKDMSKANAFIKNSTNLDARVTHFKAKKSSNIFKFVDQVFAGNRRGAYKELQKLMLARENEIYIFTMLTTGLRNIAYAKFDSPAFNRLPPFIKSKIKQQASKYTQEQILDLYAVFYGMDRDVKFGQLLPEILLTSAVEKVLTYN